MTSPFETISYLWLWLAFFVLLVLFLLVGYKAGPAFSKEEQKQIKEQLDKRPMMALEMAGTPKRAEEVLTVTRRANKNAVGLFRTAIAWDYLFIFVYPAWIAVGCMIVSRFVSEHNLPGAGLGLFLIILMPLTSLLDAVEDYAILRVLDNQVVSPWPEIAKWCALPKFAIALLAGIGYVIIYGIIAFIWAKATGR
ncbi:MAG: hypothetical protein ICV60_10060 [Pyrinomonadaceae bacterium]|nr:hypothetical protein [Pyrinomonadaceae bacterium]